MKGQGIIFNWIFITVVGVLFLSFFVGFAVKYQSIQKEKESFKLATGIDTSLAGLQSSNLFTTLTYQKKLNFDVFCDKFNVDSFSVPLQEKILFAESLKTDKLHVWVKDFNFPYKVSQLYFIAGDTQFYLVGQNSLEFPTNFPVQTIEPSQVQGKKGKFVYFSESQAQGSNYIIIKEHTIKYPDGSELPYFGDLVYGAIFSSKAQYSCNLQRILDQLQSVNSIYLTKAQYFSTWVGCSYDLTLFRRVPELIQAKDYTSLEENQKNLGLLNEKFCKEVF